MYSVLLLNGAFHVNMNHFESLKDATDFAIDSITKHLDFKAKFFKDGEKFCIIDRKILQSLRVST